MKINKFDLVTRILNGIDKGLNESLSAYNQSNEKYTEYTYNGKKIKITPTICEMTDDECKFLINKIVKEKNLDGKVNGCTTICIGLGMVNFYWQTDLNGCVHIVNYNSYWKGIGEYIVNIDFNKLNMMLEQKFPNPLLNSKNKLKATDVYKMSSYDYVVLIDAIINDLRKGLKEANTYFLIPEGKCIVKWKIGNDGFLPEIITIYVSCEEHVKHNIDIDMQYLKPLLRENVLNFYNENEDDNERIGHKYVFTPDDYDKVSDTIANDLMKGYISNVVSIVCDGGNGYILWKAADNNIIEKIICRGSWRGIGKYVIDIDKKYLLKMVYLKLNDLSNEYLD